MQNLKAGFAIAFATVLVFGINSVTDAFHSGGVGECSGCHNMHSPKAGGSSLLVGSDQSSTCLSCHEKSGDTGPNSYHVSTADSDMPAGAPPKQRTPGGDFGWLKKNYSFTVLGTTITESGASHGHNIVAADFNYVADPANTIAPGGTFVSANLACNSCHDPHGKLRRLSNNTIVATGAPIVESGSYDTSKGNSTPNPIPAGQSVGTYRLLAGLGYNKAPFTGVPVAVAPTTYNQSEASNQVRVAYGRGSTAGQVAWGQWCSTCHADMYITSGHILHPTDERNISSRDISNYKLYVSTGKMTGMFPAGQGPYLSLVPFGHSTNNYNTIGSYARSDGSQLTVPGSLIQVTCLTCHRAHASGFSKMTRWQMESEFLTVANASRIPIWPGTDNGAPAEFARGRTEAEQRAAYYDRPATVFGAYQRSLCNKCHVED